MLLLRGIKGEPFAKKIKKGMVDCRDILSAILQPPVTGYDFSDYYEKHLVKALLQLGGNEVGLKDPEFLYSVLIDPILPHIYLTYFHVLNENSLEWIDHFDDDYSFIAVNAKIDKVSGCAIGNQYFGTKMRYVKKITDKNQLDFVKEYGACLNSIEYRFKNKEKLISLVQFYCTLVFPLICRVEDDKYNDIENEFRIFSVECPRITKKLEQYPRDVIIYGEKEKYKGTLIHGQNTMFEIAGHKKTCKISLMDLLIKEKGNITISSQFNTIYISKISDDYRFIGGKEECKKFIQKMIDNKPKDIFVEKMVERFHSYNENVKFARGFYPLQLGD